MANNPSANSNQTYIVIDGVGCGIGELGGISAKIRSNTALTELDNDSFYDDAGLPLSSRKAQWVLYLNGEEVYDSGFVALNAAIPIGTSSTAMGLNTPNGLDDFSAYLATQGKTLTVNDFLTVGLTVRNGKFQESTMTKIVLQEGVNFEIADLEPPINYMPGKVFFSDTIALQNGVPRYKWYRLSSPNAYGSDNDGQLRQLMYP